MTWVTSERAETTASTDGKYQVRPFEGQHALYQTGLGRPLMVGALDDCRHLAEVLESDTPLDQLPPLRNRKPPDLAADQLARLARLVGRCGARLALLRGASAPRELLALELGRLRKLSCSLMHAAYEHPDPQ